MDALERLSKKQIREFFSKSWMTHDAMWYMHCMNALGAEKANELNRSAVKSMGAFEIKRIKKLLGYNFEKAENWDQLKEVIINAFSLIKTDFMDIFLEFPEDNLFRGGFNNCFAHDGVRRMGFADKYDCAVITRLEAWWEGLGVKYEIMPQFQGCLMNKNDTCSIDFRFNFNV